MEQLKYRIWSKSNKNKKPFGAFQLLVLPDLEAISHEDAIIYPRPGYSVTFKYRSQRHPELNLSYEMEN